MMKATCGAARHPDCRAAPTLHDPMPGDTATVLVAPAHEDADRHRYRLKTRRDPVTATRTLASAPLRPFRERLPELAQVLEDFLVLLQRRMAH